MSLLDPFWNGNVYSIPLFVRKMKCVSLDRSSDLGDFP